MILNWTYHPLYTFSIYACVCVGKLSPRFSYFQLFSTEILAEHDRGNTSVARSQTGCRRQAFLSGLYRWMQARQRNIEGEGRTGVCIGERITDSLLERVGDGGRRKREGSTVEQTRYDRSVLQQPAGGSPYIDEFFCSLHHHTHALCLLSSSASLILYLSPSLTLGLRHSQSLGFFSFVAPRSYYFFPYDDSFVPSSSHSLNSSKSRQFCDERRT